MADLPDFLQDQTEEAIRRRMLARVPDHVDKSEGSFIWDSLAPAAYELYMSANWAQEVLRRGFASTTFGGYLDLRCEEHGVTRRPAKAAEGQVQFSGEPGTTVLAGTRVATSADPVSGTPSIEFETTAEAVLNAQGTALVGIKAVEAGSLGNVAAGAINVPVSSIPGVTGISNPAATTGGAEAESDASLLERLMLKVRSPGTSGNKADYVQWGLEVDGVGGVQVQPLWNGPGTVKVFIIDKEKRAASSELVAAVQNYIAPDPAAGSGKAPIGASVTVASAEEIPINVSAKLTLVSGATLDQAQSAIAQALRDYLRELAFADSVVRYSRLSAFLLDIPQIVDLSELTLNGGTGNIEIGLGQVAVAGTVNVRV
jgi:uncharacterized phage protein gp47/JayE